MKHQRLIMLDIGGVIKTRSCDSGLWLTSRYLETPLVTGCESYLPFIRDLAQGRLIIVSRGRDKEEVRKKTKWYKHHNISKLTGIYPCQIIFCNRREEKSDICKKFGVRAVVDNKPEVFIPMLSHIPHRNLFSPKAEDLVPAEGNLLSQLVITYTWRHLHQIISRQLAA